MKKLNYKTKILTTFIFAFLCLHSYSQTKGITLSVIGTSARIEGYDMISRFSNDTPKTNVSFGIRYHKNLTKNLDLSIKANYLNIGTGFNDAYGDGWFDYENYDIDVVANLHYIQFPIMMDYSILRNRNLYFGCGPYFSTLLNANFKGDLGEYGTLFESQEMNREITEDLSFFDFGLSAEIGSQLKISDAIGLNVSGAYNYGILNMDPEGDLLNNRFFSHYKLKNRFAAIEIGMVYYL